jgi:hypothetical protein
VVLNEPTTLPEGTVVDLVAGDEGDDLTDEERRALHEALSASWKSAEAGRLLREIDDWWRANRLAAQTVSSPNWPPRLTS